MHPETIRHSSCRCWMLALLVLASGCFNPQTRFQSAEETERENDLRLEVIRDVIEVANVEPQAVHGVGLVTDLEGTGGSPKGAFRNELEVQLRKQKVQHITALLESRNNALVLVTALIPPGARRGDPIDVEVTLPPGSPATSLRGGYLQDCVLRNYEAKANLSEKHARSDQLVAGHILGKARGPLLVGLGHPGEPAETHRAHIWGGGTSLVDRQYFLALKNDRKFAAVANAIALRLNAMFPDDSRKRQQVLDNQRLLILKEVTDEINHSFQTPALGRGETAKAHKNEMVAIRVPYGYRLNQERYLRVALFIPLRPDSGEHLARYRKRLHKMLHDPKDAVVAALRLEALGKESIPVLKEALSDGSPLVRFCAAESLTYLGSTAGSEELARIALKHPEVRAYALTALASLNESVSQHRLSELLSADNAELRCGAFRALRLMVEPRLLENPQNHGEAAIRLLGPELIGDTFWVHRVAPKSRPLIYFAVSKRPEIVLFGSDTHLVPPVKILVGADITVTADRGDERSPANPHGRCTISRTIASDTSVDRLQCSLRLDDVLRTLAELGGSYPEAIDLLRRADERRCLSCPICIKLPDADPVETLAERGRDPEFLKE